jgi:hypothetical protein
VVRSARLSCFIFRKLPAADSFFLISDPPFPAIAMVSVLSRWARVVGSGGASLSVGSKAEAPVNCVL